MGIHQPLISIITIVYNAQKTLEQTILSVINQSYTNIEYIIIDGGSSDGSLEIIKKYEQYISYWISEKDSGISDAFNKGIAKATGELIGIINADDWYETNALEVVVNNYNFSTDVYCGNLALIDKNNFPFKIMKSKPWFLFYGMHIMHPTTFVKKTCYEKYGAFDVCFKISMDYDFLLRLKKNKCNFAYINTLIANMRIEGVSSDLKKTFNEELLVKKRHTSGFIFLLGYLYNRINYFRLKIMHERRKI